LQKTLRKGRKNKKKYFFRLLLVLFLFLSRFTCLLISILVLN